MFRSYYQFGQGDAGYPVYVKICDEALEGRLSKVLASVGLSKLDDKAIAKIVKLPLDSIRVLDITSASGMALNQINIISESDAFGEESVIPSSGYRVYRHKGIGMMVYSFGSTVWQLGVSEDCGSDKFMKESRIIFARFLSLALAKYGVIGFWGVVVENSLVVMRAKESKGEVVFIDSLKMRLAAQGEIKEIRSGFQIVRLGKCVNGKSILLKRDELISFLMTYNSYLDYGQSSSIIGQIVNKITSVATGIMYPAESFKDGRAESKV